MKIENDTVTLTPDEMMKIYESAPDMLDGCRPAVTPKGMMFALKGYARTNFFARRIIANWVLRIPWPACNKYFDAFTETFDGLCRFEKNYDDGFAKLPSEPERPNQKAVATDGDLE